MGRKVRRLFVFGAVAAALAWWRDRKLKGNEAR